LNGDRILFIGSDAAEQTALGRIITAHYDLISANTVAEAKRYSQLETPDLILLSQTHDGNSLYHNTADLKAHKRLRNVPVIAVVQEKEAGAVTDASPAGQSPVIPGKHIVDVIGKPFDDAEVLWRLRVHLNIARREREMLDRLDRLQSGLITSISEMVECRDENTGGHIARTSRYVMLLGMNLIESGAFVGELTEENVELIGRAAPLHDIGKVGVSDAVLLKPGKLTDEEWGVMKQHAGAGKVMIDRLSQSIPSLAYLAVASDIAGTHHEKYDGSGYPDGLAGEDIPLCGRIMAVADVYDALVADRIYRKAMSQDQAYDIITKSGGTHFDPRIVGAFVNVFDILSAVAVAANDRIAEQSTH
jgi:putative two-component system response regulator